MPHLNDPIFNKSLIYLCDNNKEGALGLIINKPILSENAVEILKKTGLKKTNPKLDIYFGGPVNIEMGLILHGSDYKTDSTISVSKSISLTSNKQIINDIINGKGPNKFRFSMGYAGWEKGQLEKELENGDWLLVPADVNIIFSVPDNEKWKSAAIKFGININSLGGSAGLA
tara:strand:- start:250 stop:765 length:516 start_codon:yes stop_codon:yes gene_type:complete